MNEEQNEVLLPLEEATEDTEGATVAAEAPVTPDAILALPEETVDVVTVVFRTTGKAYYFDPKELSPVKGNGVIVETARGLEFGKVKRGRTAVKKSELVLPLRPVVRLATEDDTERFLANCDQEKYAIRVCKEKAAEHKLDIHLVSAEYTFDNRKLLFYFTSENRVDFRELVKTLASIFRVRIELRQIGIRDEARMLGGLGVCGRPFCCAGFLSDFVQVSIKMAKEQNFSLNSSKISGSCGRLMCCLRYEHETYEAALREVPPVGSMVRTPAGDGVVTEVRPLTGIVRVRYESDAPRLYPVSEITVLRHGKSGAYMPPLPKDEEAVPASEESASPDASPAGEKGAEENAARPHNGKRHRSRQRHRDGQRDGQRNEEKRTDGKNPEGRANEGQKNEPSKNPHKKPEGAPNEDGKRTQNHRPHHRGRHHRPHKKPENGGENS